MKMRLRKRVAGSDSPGQIMIKAKKTNIYDREKCEIRQFIITLTGDETFAMFL